MIRTTLTLGALALCFSVSATVINVPADQPTIQQALNVAATGDTILVQPGTYTENLSWPATQDLKLFSAGDTTNTIIDGGGSGRVLAMGTASGTNTIIRGFRLTNGATTNWASGTGAGISVTNGSPTFEDVVVDNCIGNGDRSYGAGVSVDGGGVITFRNSTIHDNHGQPTGGSYNYGGGMYVEGGSTINLENSDIKNNTLIGASRAYGGGIYITGGTLNLSDCWLSGNDLQGTSWSYGGGIRATSGSSVTITASTITQNKLSNTSRTYGGGIYIDGGTLDLYNSYITDNDLNTTTWSLGNGLSINSSAVAYIENCLISGNQTDGTGFTYDGGGIYVDASTLDVVFSTIADNIRVGNQNLDGSGIHASDATVTVNSSISWNDNPSAEISLNGTSTVTVDYSDIRNGFVGTANISTLPQFVGSGDYHLQATSPCVEQADPVGFPIVDIEYSTRPGPVGTDPDMGAYEESGLPGGGGTPVATACCDTTICSGDSVQLNITVSGGTPPYSYTWSPGTGLNSTSIPNPIAFPLTTTPYQVIISDSMGESDTVNLLVTIDPCPGVDEIAGITAQVYPNPATDAIIIEGNIDQTILQLFDQTGRRLMHRTIRSVRVEIDLSELSSGLYYYSIHSDDAKTSGKLVKR